MSERYLLDTNILSEIIQTGRDSAVLGMIARVGQDKICTSAIVASEMRYGVERKGSTLLRDKVERVLRNIEIVPYASDCAHAYGIIRTTLEREGRTIGAMDLLIAAHALALNRSLVTDNCREFERVADLRVVNWLVPASREGGPTA
jgi:tRNA(fMet)-specific endonuclease VapC